MKTPKLLFSVLLFLSSCSNENILSKNIVSNDNIDKTVKNKNIIEINPKENKANEIDSEEKGTENTIEEVKHEILDTNKENQKIQLPKPLFEKIKQPNYSDLELINGGKFTFYNDKYIGARTKDIIINSFYVSNDITKKDLFEYGFTDDLINEEESKVNVKTNFLEAIKIANARSKSEGFAIAYNESTCHLIDSNGQETNNIQEVKGYRLPTVSELQYLLRKKEIEESKEGEEEVVEYYLTTESEINYSYQTEFNPYYFDINYNRTVNISKKDPYLIINKNIENSDTKSLIKLVRRGNNLKSESELEKIESLRNISLEERKCNNETPCAGTGPILHTEIL